MTLSDALHAVHIAAAHHQEIAELAVAEKSLDFTDDLLDAGDQLDVAIVLAYLEGAKLLELRRAAKHLTLRYLTALTAGVFD